MSAIKLENVAVIGSNRRGYEFCVGLCMGNWLGFARASDPAQRQMLFILHEVSEGLKLGVSDRDLAIRATGAAVQVPEQGFGGIDEWLVPEALRGKPIDFACRECGKLSVGDCPCEHCEAYPKR